VSEAGRLPTPVIARTATPGLRWAVAVLATGSALGVLAGVNALLAIAATIALAYTAVSVMDVRLGLCLFVVFTFLEVLPVTLGPVVSLTKLAGLVLALGWVATVTARSGRRGQGLLAAHPAAAWLLVSLVALAAASVAWAGSPAAAIAATFRYALNAVLFVIVYNVVRSRRDLQYVVAAYVTGSAVSAAYGILLPASSAGAGLERVGGTIGDANEFAAVLGSALPLAVALAVVDHRSTRMRALGLGAALLSAAGIALSLSRGGLLAVAVMLVAGLVLAGRWRAIVAAVCVVIALLGAGYFLVVAPPMARERVTASDGGTGRTDVWKVGWRMVEARPLLGVGAGNFPTASVRYLLRPGQLARSDLVAGTPKVAHNTYLNVLAELGVFGASAFLGLIGFAMGAGLRAARAFERQGDVPMEVLSRAWLVGVAGILAAYVFISAEFSKQLWLLLALGPCLLAMTREGT
jgi:O-antigen ligase